METLSTSLSVTTFRPSSTTTTTSALLLPNFKPPSSSSNHLHLFSRRNSLSNQQHLPSQQPQILTKSPILHKATSSPSSTLTAKASSGYAAALLDISLCQNSSDLVFKDATRFANLMRARPVLELMRNPFVNAAERNQALKELIENGKFEKHFAALLKMLIIKNKFAIIGDVLDEFRRMYYELCAGSGASIA